MPNYYLFHGFLSEKKDLDYGAHRVDDNDWYPIFGDQGRKLAKHVDDPVYVVNYPANHGFFEYITGDISGFEFWRRTLFWLNDTLPEVDNFCEYFAQRLKNEDETPIVIGHSMGGRAALKIRENAPVKAISMAPAISESETDWEKLSQYAEPCELFYTEHDLMLGLYGLKWIVGWGDNIGVGGLPDDLPDALNPVDVTTTEDGSKRGHGDFMPVDEIIARYSEIISIEDQTATKRNS